VEIRVRAALDLSCVFSLTRPGLSLRRFAASVPVAALLGLAVVVGHSVAASRSRVVTVVSFAGTPYGFAQSPNGIAWLSATTNCDEHVTFRTVVFSRGPAIYTLDARSGAPKLIAFANGTPIGLSISGHRVAWAEATPTGGRIRAVTLN
jgi:hypothetical protein